MAGGRVQGRRAGGVPCCRAGGWPGGGVLALLPRSAGLAVLAGKSTRCQAGGVLCWQGCRRAGGSTRWQPHARASATYRGLRLQYFADTNHAPATRRHLAGGWNTSVINYKSMCSSLLCAAVFCPPNGGDRHNRTEALACGLVCGSVEQRRNREPHFSTRSSIRCPPAPARASDPAFSIQDPPPAENPRT